MREVGFSGWFDFVSDWLFCERFGSRVFDYCLYGIGCLGVV